MSTDKYDIDEYNRYIDDMDIIAKEAEEADYPLRDYLLGQVGVEENTVDVLIKAWNPEYVSDTTTLNKEEQIELQEKSLFDKLLDRPVSLKDAIVIILTLPFALLLLFICLFMIYSVTLAGKTILILIFFAVVCMLIGLIKGVQSKLFCLGMSLSIIICFVHCTSLSINEGRICWDNCAFLLLIYFLTICIYIKIKKQSNSNLTSQSTSNEVISKMPQSFLLLGLTLNVLSSVPALIKNPSFIIAILFFLFWGMIPYFTLALISLKIKSKGAIIAGGCLVLLADAIIRIQIFFFPASSTDGIALFFAPIWFTVVFLPIGMVFGWFAERIIKWYQTMPTSTKTRTLIARFGYGFLIITILTICFLFVLNPNTFVSNLRKIVDTKARIGEPRIVFGQEAFQKTLIFDGSTNGRVLTIQTGNFDDEPNNEIAVFKKRGITFLDSQDFSLKKSIKCQSANPKAFCFSSSNCLVDIDNDGTFKIMQQGGGYGDVGLLDIKGKPLWKFHPDPTLSPKGMVAGDVNQDGHLEFYVADYDGLFHLNQDGKVIWKASNDVDDVDIVYTEKTDNPQIITISDKDGFQTWDFQGIMVSKFQPGMNFYKFEIVEWPSSNNILTGYKKSKFYVLDLSGKIILEHKVDSCLAYHGPYGIAVKFSKDEKHYLAVVTESSSGIAMSELNIFNASGEHVYQEILNSNNGISVLTDLDTGNEYLLIAEAWKNVWKYEKL